MKRSRVIVSRRGHGFEVTLNIAVQLPDGTPLLRKVTSPWRKPISPSSAPAERQKHPAASDRRNLAIRDRYVNLRRGEFSLCRSVLIFHSVPWPMRSLSGRDCARFAKSAVSRGPRRGRSWSPRGRAGNHRQLGPAPVARRATTTGVRACPPHQANVALLDEATSALDDLRRRPIFLPPAPSAWRTVTSASVTAKLWSSSVIELGCWALSGIA